MKLKFKIWLWRVLNMPYIFPDGIVINGGAFDREIYFLGNATINNTSAFKPLFYSGDTTKINLGSD